MAIWLQGGLRFGPTCNQSYKSAIGWLPRRVFFISEIITFGIIFFDDPHITVYHFSKAIFPNAYRTSKINVPGRHKRFQLENQNDRTWSKIIANSNGLQACLSLFYFDIYTYSYCAIRFLREQSPSMIARKLVPS